MSSAIWTTIHRRFLTELAELNIDVDNITGGLCGAPVREHPIMVVGKNWGGKDKNTSSLLDDSEPDDCGLADFKRSRWFGKFLMDLMRQAISASSSDIDNIVKDRVFWTNAVLVRSRNTDALTQSRLSRAVEPSMQALSQMLNAVRPTCVLCFGNGRDRFSPSRAVLVETCGLNRNWMRHADKSWSTGRTKVRMYRDALSEHRDRSVNTQPTTIWSFPHPSHGWGSQVLRNDCLIRAIGFDLSMALQRNHSNSGTGGEFLGGTPQATDNR